MTVVEVILSQGSVACRQDHHQDSRRVHSAVARLKGSSAQKTSSTCFSAAADLGSVARSVEAQVKFPDFSAMRTLISCAVFTASFGPGGFRTTRVHTTRQRQQAQRQEPATPRSLFAQVLPLLILFAFSLLSALPTFFTTPRVPDPRFSFEPSTRFNLERKTHALGVNYHVNDAEFSRHPIAAEIARLKSTDKPQSMPVLRQFEDNVDRAFTQEKYALCQSELDSKQRRKERAVGFFGIGADWDKVKQIEAEPAENCETLKRMGLLR